MIYTTTIASARPPAVRLMRNVGLEPDPWQMDVLEGEHPRLLLNCCRQAGKSTVVALLALSEAVFTPYAKVLLLSRSLRQSSELFRQVTFYLDRLDHDRALCKRRTAEELELTNRSRIICLPCRQETIRGYSRVTLLVIDEAAQVPDDLYQAVRPMLAVSGGRLICLSTPYGRRGFFYQAWAKGGGDWHRIEIPATSVSRIPAAFLAEERRALGEYIFRREYLCSFDALEGLVYPDFARCVASELPAKLRGADDILRGGQLGTAPGRLPANQAGSYRLYGGIDFGFRNPFAALWGFDDEGVLWITGEHYARQKPLDYHAERMPRDVMYYADPSGAEDIHALIRGNFRVRQANNAVRLGIAAVTGRLGRGTLKVLAGRCPNLLSEAELYRYSDDPRERSAETPLDEHNHALAALRYLICSLDERTLAQRPAPVVAATAEAQRGVRDVLEDERAWAG